MDIKREEQAFRIRKDEGGRVVAEVTFPEQHSRPDVWLVNHTWVDDELRGQGIASRLLAAVDEAARSENKKIRPTCSYAVAWYERHPEKQDILADDSK